MEIFHGGCHGCNMQDEKGLGYCVGCKFFEPDWSLPNLNDCYATEQARIKKIKDKARKLANKK